MSGYADPSGAAWPTPTASGPRRPRDRLGPAPTAVLDGSGAPFYRWFPDGTLNTCHNALDRHVAAAAATSPR